MHPTRTSSASRRRLTLRRLRLEVLAGPDAGHQLLADADTVRIGTRDDGDLVLTDPTVSRVHADLVRTGDRLTLRDRGSRNGTWLGAARVREAEISGVQVLRVGDTTLRITPVDDEVALTPSTEAQFGDLVGGSAVMREVYAVLERVAPTRLNVLVTGETGTGKELVCRALHARSPRASGPLVVFDCSATPENLIESELFGHARGAFTGADRTRAGAFERAHGGTLFLDELGELPLTLQTRLLRALEAREIRRVGDDATRAVDVRVVAATHRALHDEVAAGTFRADLFYRLAVVELALPPLRDRKGDLPALVAHVLQTAELAHPVRRVHPDALQLLEAWHWPGNVRELRNTVLRALTLATGDELTADQLRPRAAGAAPSDAETVELPRADRPWREAKEQVLAEFERAYLEDLVGRADGNLARAARIAGMDRRTVSRLLKLHGLAL